MRSSAFSFGDRRLALALLVAGMLAALGVAAFRAHYEHRADRVEIAMDYLDFSTLARSYGYNETQFLIALRRAGLTSLAIPEELGSAIGSSGGAQLAAASDLANAYRLGSLREPSLLALARTGNLGSGVYLIVSDPATLPRYRTSLARHLGPHAVVTIRAANPAILYIRSQIDYLNTLGFGIPEEPLAIARAANLHVVPRLQNDPKYTASEIDAIMGDFAPADRVSTVIFFGQRSEVLGFPNSLADTAAAFDRFGYTFGSIETYDPKQLQKGNDGLAKLIVGRTTRVQAIAKTEQDTLDFEPIVARYLLGVRERNVRVVYLRPFTKAIAGETFTPEGANIQLVGRIADGIRARGYKLGPATPLEDFKTPLIAIVLIALAVPAFFVLLMEDLGIRAPAWALAAYVLTVLVIIAGVAVNHELLGRKIVALAGAILFATGAVVAIRRSFLSPVPRTFGASVAAGFRTTGVALGVALGGAAVVVGLCSSALLMEEIDRFTGVKAVIVVPPVLAALIVLFSSRFGGSIAAGTGALARPVRAYQIGLFAILAGAALLYVMRSGNQSDIAPSGFELALRSHLTAFLGVRPRFKEFVVGFPLMMLLPTLSLEIRRTFGWVLALGIAIGTADVVDTFSHLHTPLVASLLRVLNGAAVGCLIGIAAIAFYRAVAGRVSRPVSVTERIVTPA